MRARIILPVALLLLSPCSSWATDVLLDHVEFVRESGKPQSASAPFSACDPEGTFTLVVDNGQDGTHRVSSGTISVNGIPVVMQSDFSQQVAVITKPLMNIQESNQLEVLLASAPGSVIKVTVRAEMICLAVTIDSPVSGSTVSQNEITVFGHARHRTPEIGVKVSGVLAQMNGDAWVANNVPVSVGENTLTAVLTDEKGRTAQTSAIVTLPAVSTGSVRLLSTVESGIAPLRVAFSLENNTGRNLVSYKMDFEGDGVVDLEAGAFESVEHAYATEGIFNATLLATDAAGNQYVGTLAVNVHALPPLKTKWDAMKAALTVQDLTGAVKNFASVSADTYGAIFSSLGSILPQIAVEMQNIELVYLRGDRAKYRMRVEELSGGVPTEFTYYIYFVRDEDGFWRIRDF